MKFYGKIHNNTNTLFFFMKKMVIKQDNKVIFNIRENRRLRMGSTDRKYVLFPFESTTR